MICLCGALKAPVTCSKGTAYSVCVWVCVCVCGGDLSVETSALVTCSKGRAYSVCVCVCVCRDVRDLSVWSPQSSGHLQQGYDI